MRTFQSRSYRRITTLAIGCFLLAAVASAATPDAIVLERTGIYQVHMEGVLFFASGDPTGDPEAAGLFALLVNDDGQVFCEGSNRASAPALPAVLAPTPDHDRVSRCETTFTIKVHGDGSTPLAFPRGVTLGRSGWMPEPQNARAPTCQGLQSPAMSQTARTPAEEALSREIASLLLSARGGDTDAVDRIVPLLYERLRSLARRQLRRLRPGRTLDTTALVHETYIKLAAGPEVDWRDRNHFLCAAAVAMRHILVDEAGAGRRSAGEAKP